MTNDQELRDLISKARHMGGTVDFSVDDEAFEKEGRSVITRIRVEGLKGIGPGWMSPIAAAEALRPVSWWFA